MLDDQCGSDGSSNAAAPSKEAQGDQQQQAAADRRAQRVAGRERQTGRRRDGIGQHRAGSPDDFLQCEAEAGAAEDRHDEPRRVVSFASDQIHQRNQCEHDAKYVRIKGFADGLGRAHQFRMIGVDPVEHVRDARVEAAQRCPAGTDKQQE